MSHRDPGQKLGQVAQARPWLGTQLKEPRPRPRGGGGHRSRTDSHCQSFCPRGRGTQGCSGCGRMGLHPSRAPGVKNSHLASCPDTLGKSSSQVNQQAGGLGERAGMGMGVGRKGGLQTPTAAAEPTQCSPPPHTGPCLGQTRWSPHASSEGQTEREHCLCSSSHCTGSTRSPSPLH